MLRYYLLAISISVLLALPASVSAQDGSVLSLLPTEGRTLTIGEQVEGALSASDMRGPDDAPLEAWTLEAEAGQRLTLDLRSDAFDAYLYLVGPGFGETQWDDDGAGGCDARVQARFLESGVFTVVASSRDRETGPYTLSVSTETPPVALYPCGGVSPNALMGLPLEDRVLTMGAEGTGSFDGSERTVEDDRPAEVWTFDASAGERVTFRLLSNDFDAYLYLAGPGLTEILTDDDSGGDRNAEITVQFPQTATYRVVAAALTAGSVGSYTIQAREPVDLATLPTEDRRVSVGGTASGTLPDTAPVVLDGRPAQAWALEGEAGQAVTIRLLSDDFDPYLYVAGPGLEQPIEDDDSAGETNAQVQLQFPETGTYRLLVSAYMAGVGGDFQIEVTPN